MSNLSQRLARLRATGNAPESGQKGEKKEIQSSRAGPAEETPPGKGWMKQDDFFWERSIDYPLYLPDSLPDPFIVPDETKPEDLVFYDLETTGLSGGAGNTAFLIGIGKQIGDIFRVWQLFLADYPGEEAMLRRYAELSDETLYGEGLPQVSYNGRSFDSQVLRTRFLLNRMVPPTPPQVDLLYPSRRLWKPVLENLTLRTIEQKVLDFHRVDDLPGSEAPDAWFEWLKKDPRRIEGVFQHNADDIVSLARLLAKLELWGSVDPETADLTGFADSVPDGASVSSWGMAVQWSYRDQDKEYSWLVNGLKRGEQRCGMELALRLRRENRFTEACKIWESINQKGVHFPSALELAKYWEHREKNPGRALEIIEPLFGLLLSERRRLDLEHRRARLERKIALADILKS